MGKNYFIFGNQALELKEKTDEVIHQILPEEEINEYSVFRFDANDFYSKEREKNDGLLNDFRNTCDTVSWLATRIVVVLNEIQVIPTKKSALTKIESALEEIRLVQKDDENSRVWIDAATAGVKGNKKTITGSRLVESISPLGGKAAYVKLHGQWENISVEITRKDGAELISLKEFLNETMPFELIFDASPETVEASVNADEKLVCYLKEVISEPRKDVSVILTANVQNTRTIHKELTKLLESKTEVVKTTISYDDFRPTQWIIERARKRNLQINSSVADLMIEICGSDMSVLNGEIEKLSILFPPDTRIKASDLIEHVSYSKKFSIFRVADFLVKKDLRNVLESMESILRDHPADAVSVFGIIASQFRRLLKISWMMESGLPENMIIGQLKLNPWIAKQIINQCGKYSCRELENIVVYLSKQDLAVKYHAKEAMVILEQICYQICQGLFAASTPIKKRWVP